MIKEVIVVFILIKLIFKKCVYSDFEKKKYIIIITPLIIIIILHLKCTARKTRNTNVVEETKYL